jgi:hypothetical protein
VRLKEGFLWHVEAASAQKSRDPRDEMLSLTPFLDCACRLGHDPAAELSQIGATGAPWLVETFDAFVRRSDVTLAAFGWSIVETPDGPAYRFAWPAWPKPKQPSIRPQGPSQAVAQFTNSGQRHLTLANARVHHFGAPRSRCVVGLTEQRSGCRRGTTAHPM